MRMRNVPKFRKIPKGLARGEPLRHPDHPRPRTRREFIAQGFMAGGASVVLPSLAGLLANPRIADAAPPLAPDIAKAVTACNITQGAGMIPFICFDLSGGANIMGSNVLGGMQGGQLDFISVAGYSKLGLPGTMVPNSSTKSNIDSSLTLRYHSSPFRTEVTRCVLNPSQCIRPTYRACSTFRQRSMMTVTPPASAIAAPSMLITPN